MFDLINQKSKFWQILSLKNRNFDTKFTFFYTKTEFFYLINQKSKIWTNFDPKKTQI